MPLYYIRANVNIGIGGTVRAKTPEDAEAEFRNGMADFDVSPDLYHFFAAGEPTDIEIEIEAD